MELKRLIANDSKSALQCVRDECGDNALIVSTNKVGKKTEVIYAIDISEKGVGRGFKRRMPAQPSFQMPSEKSKRRKTMKAPMLEISWAKSRESWER